MKQPLTLLLSILGSNAAGFIGAFFTVTSVTSWYATLNQPPLNPPNWVFGPVWTTLYTLMGIALYLVITTKSKQSKTLSYVFFGTQLALNTLWSILYFGFERIDLALIEIVVLLVFILLTLWQIGKINNTAAWLLVPYVAWVSFATYLNAGYFLLN